MFRGKICVSGEMGAVGEWRPQQVFCFRDEHHNGFEEDRKVKICS